MVKILIIPAPHLTSKKQQEMRIAGVGGAGQWWWCVEHCSGAAVRLILTQDHDLNFNDTTASNNHQLYNGSNLNSAPFVIIQHYNTTQHSTSNTATAHFGSD